MDFLEKLNYLMEKNHLNKNTLSKACNIPYTTIDGWYKKGYEGLKLTTLRKLAEYFGTSLDYWASEDVLTDVTSKLGSDLLKERIRKIRKGLDLTQQAFAERIGLKQNSIALIESGKRNISTQAILSICREFNVNEEWLRTGVGEMFVPINMENQLIEWAGKVFRERDESFKKRFVAMLMDLSEDKWELLEEMARKLVDVGDTQRTSEESKEEFAACFTVDEAEAAYIKSRSANVQRRASFASNTTEGDVANK